MSDSEREFLRRTLQAGPTRAQRWQRGAVNGIAVWAVCMVLFVLAWTLVAWLVRHSMHVEVGWKSAVAGTVVALGALGSLVTAVLSSLRWVASWRDYSPLVRADLEGGRVIEEYYRLDEAKRFQEPEHGGLIYFLRTDDERVLTFFDYDSQDLGVRDQDPLQSGFVPRTDLTIVRAPRSAFVIEMRLDGEPLAIGAPRDAIVRGIFLVPEDRKRSGLVLDDSIAQNVSLASLDAVSRGGLIDVKAERRLAEEQRRALRIKTPDVDTPAASLSGGNQQKVVLAKWLCMRPRVVIFDEPTRGVDAGAKSEIYALMRELADRGVAILMISSDMEEVIGVSDRVAVMHEGAIRGILDRDQLSEANIMHLAIGNVLH